MSQLHRSRLYEPTEWEDRVLDDQNGSVLVQGTPIDEENMNNLEAGVLIGHYDIGLLAMLAAQIASSNEFELQKLKKQKFLQGKATITNATTDNGYYRSADPVVMIALTGFPQANAPDYEVIVTPNDPADAGTLSVIEKTQNGFKVMSTSTSKTISFTWTLLNPQIS